MLNGIALIVIALTGVLAYIGVMNWSIRRGALARLYAFDDSTTAPVDSSSRDSALGRRDRFTEQRARVSLLGLAAFGGGNHPKRHAATAGPGILRLLGIAVLGSDATFALAPLA